MGWATGLEGKSYPKKPRGHEIDALELFRASPTERIALIKSGVPATAAKRLFAGLDIAQRDTLRALDLPVATINKMAKAARRLDPAASERVLGIARLVGQVQAMVEESGNPDGFDAAEWVSRWLREPVAALGGKRPLDLLDTMEGQSLVSQALARMQTGAYS
jgi:putative toxin-antitoxin system antitoxin component (TIGR02293 family)